MSAPRPGPEPSAAAVPGARDPAGAGRRLRVFVAGLAAMAVGLEMLVRLHEPMFEAASHRALAKVAMCERHARVDVLFLGTSRTQDGVSPALMSRALAERDPALADVRGFNAAFTSSSLDALEALAARLLSRKDLRCVVLELSDPQRVNPATPWDGAPPDTATLEGRLGVLARHVRFLRHRSAFVSDNLSRLPALLLFAPALGGWEVKGSEQVAAWLGRTEASPTGFDAAAWRPSLIRPTGRHETLSEEDSRTAERFTAVARRYRERGVSVVFASPPLSAEWSPAPERDSMKPLFREIAERSGCEVWDFSSLPLDRRFFRNPSHLGTEGRAHYSYALAGEVARLLGKP